MIRRLAATVPWALALLLPVAGAARAQSLPGDDELSWRAADAPPPPEDEGRGGWERDSRDDGRRDDRRGQGDEGDGEDDHRDEEGYRRGYRDGVQDSARSDGWRDSAPSASMPDEARGAAMDDFRGDSELSWAGEWIDTPEYGVVWRPTRVASSWRPYTYGHWSWTTAGWFWASDEPFGWAVYHYGRWSFSPGFGWVWLPGSVWAPAWVAWRWGGGYAAWCPLGPRAFVPVEPTVWVVVQQRDFVEPVQHHVVPFSQVASVLPRARAMPLAPGPSAGPRVAQVAQVTGRPVRAAAVVEVSSPRAAGASGRGVQVYRPRSAPVQAAGVHEGRPAERSGAWGGARPGSAAPRAGGFASERRAAPARDGFGAHPREGRPASERATPGSPVREGPGRPPPAARPRPQNREEERPHAAR